MPISYAEVARQLSNKKKMEERAQICLVMVVVFLFFVVGHFGNKAIENRVVVEHPTVQQSADID